MRTSIIDTALGVTKVILGHDAQWIANSLAFYAFDIGRIGVMQLGSSIAFSMGRAWA